MWILAKNLALLPIDLIQLAAIFPLMMLSAFFPKNEVYRNMRRRYGVEVLETFRGLAD